MQGSLVGWEMCIREGVLLVLECIVLEDRRWGCWFRGGPGGVVLGDFWAVAILAQDYSARIILLRFRCYR